LAARVEFQPFGFRLAGMRERAQQVVEGVVLHHHDHDVIEWQRARRRAGGTLGIGQLIGTAQRRAGGERSAPQWARPRERGDAGASVAQERAARQRVHESVAARVGHVLMSVSVEACGVLILSPSACAECEYSAR
jgi:hypothetical protein